MVGSSETKANIPSFETPRALILINKNGPRGLTIIKCAGPKATPWRRPIRKHCERGSAATERAAAAGAMAERRRSCCGFRQFIESKRE